MAASIHQDAQLAEFLAKAIHQDNLRLFVQPQISISSGKTVGGEVLLRIPSPLLFEKDVLETQSQNNYDFSSVSVNQWIQTALNQGLIHPLSEWLVKNVLKMLEEKNALSRTNVPLAVNMPPEMINKDFLNFIEECFAKYNSVDPSQICIEITEFPKAKNLDLLNFNIQNLRAMGIRVILDDFGSGYATMNYLVELLVDAVKIDQSFIQKAPYSSSARAVLKCLIELAKEMDLEVICEGVETFEQLMLIQNLKCDIIQGFLVSEPIPFHQFWLDLEKGLKPILH